MKNVLVFPLSLVAVLSLIACDQLKAPSTTQCEAAVKKIVAEATLKKPVKTDCERAVEATLPGAKKRPAPKEDGVLGKISDALDTAVGKVKGAAHKLTDAYDAAVETCEKDWSLATAQCIERSQNPGESKACTAAGEAQAKAYTEALITCETGWNLALVTCINAADARTDTAGCLAWPWSGPDATVISLLGDDAPKTDSGEAPAAN